MTTLTFGGTITLRRESGKFASKDELIDQVRERLDDALGEDVDGVGVDGESTYVVDDYTVDIT